MPKDFDVLFIPGGIGSIKNMENSSAKDEILEKISDFRLTQKFICLSNTSIDVISDLFSDTNIKLKKYT